MEQLLFECAVRAILIATGTAVALSVMRIKNVVARHQAWTGVVLSMLMLPLWTAFGYQVPIRVLSPIPQQTELTGTVSAETAPVFVTQTNNRPLAISTGDAKPQAVNWRQFMLGIYLLGTGGRRKSWINQACLQRSYCDLRSLKRRFTIPSLKGPRRTSSRSTFYVRRTYSWKVKLRILRRLLLPGEWGPRACGRDRTGQPSWDTSGKGKYPSVELT